MKLFLSLLLSPEFFTECYVWAVTPAELWGVFYSPNQKKHHEKCLASLTDSRCKITFYLWHSEGTWKTLWKIILKQKSDKQSVTICGGPQDHSCEISKPPYGAVSFSEIVDIVCPPGWKAAERAGGMCVSASHGWIVLYITDQRNSETIIIRASTLRRWRIFITWIMLEGIKNDLRRPVKVRKFRGDYLN